MTEGLDALQRARLERLVGSLRTTLEADLADQAAGRFGIDPDGSIADEDELRLDPTALVARRELADVVAHLKSEGDSARSAVARLLREAVFTHLNRLVAIRIAEALGILRPSLVSGRRSQGFRDFLELAPLLAGDETGGYWTYLRLCGDELAAEIPALFDPRNPLLALAPSPGALDDLVEDISHPEAAELWTSPDCLGWVYQFFNTAAERKAMRDAGAPRDAHELAVRNQFFTPRYVVDFLVQNSLGRRLLDSEPTSPLIDDLPLLVDPPTKRGAPISLDSARVLDPACGSGHFLLAAYDVLEHAWRHASVDAPEAAPLILSSLWGIDIDPRCSQVAAAALIFRARRSCPEGELPRPNIICARALPATTTGLDEFLAALPDVQRYMVARFTEALEDAPLLGPLLKIEERLSSEVRAAAFGGLRDPGPLVDALPEAVLQALEDDLLTTLSRIADRTTASTPERLLAAEARDTIRFVHALQLRYDAVLMNPPFGEPVPATKTYLKAAYPWIPTTSDLFALFVGRGLELCNANGYVGAITSRVGMFLSSFEEWRRRILLGHELAVLADLGEGVMEQAMVEAAAYVMGKRQRSSSDKPIFLRAVTANDRGAAISAAVSASRAGQLNPDLFSPDLDRLATLAGSPVAYWVDSATVDVLATHEPFEPAHGLVRKGLETGDDFRFVRAWWEVDSRRLTRAPDLEDGNDERAQLSCGARWAPIVKGGSSQPWFSSFLFVLDWEHDGDRLKNFRDASGKKRSFIRSTDLYFKTGFSWTRRAPRLVPYVVPRGCIPSGSRYQAFPADDPYTILGIVASNVASAFCRFYGEKFLWPNFLVGNVKSLPIPRVTDALASDLASCVKAGVQARRDVYRHLEPFREFTAPAEKIGHLEWDARSLLGDALEDRVAASYGLSREQAAGLERDMMEALSVLGKGATATEEDDEDLAEIQPWGPRLISYLAGAAFGRWDIRIGRDPRLAPSLGDPFDPPRDVPPGMLVDARGRPVTATPIDYPLSLSPARVLLDEPGHSWDIERQVLAAASFLFDNSEAACARALTAVRQKSMRQYLRRRFFKDHLGVYTKGRRKAPIYWPLYVPSGTWGTWVYAPVLARETLFAIAKAATDRLDAAETEIRLLQRELDSGGAGRSVREVANALDSEEQLAEELRRFRDEAERIAGLGWEPDLDDGIILCAAPLASLFPAWKEASGARREIKAGKYPWATVSRWANQL